MDWLRGREGERAKVEGSVYYVPRDALKRPQLPLCAYMWGRKTRKKKKKKKKKKNRGMRERNEEARALF